MIKNGKQLLNSRNFKIAHYTILCALRFVFSNSSHSNSSLYNECRESWLFLVLIIGLQMRVRIGKLFSLFLIQNICCWYSKEPSQYDGSFEH